MEGVPALREIIEKDDLMCKIDLKDAYVVIPYSSGVTEILDVRAWQYSIPIYTPSFWFKCSAENFLQTNALRNRIFKEPRSPINLLPGRYLYSGEIEGKDATISQPFMPTSKTAWVPNQQGKECFRTKEVNRISRFQLQHQDNDHLTTTAKDFQTLTTPTTSGEYDQQILPLDCQSIGEDYGSDPFSSRSVIAHSTFTARPGEEPTKERPQLGQHKPDIIIRERGDSLVANISCEKKRLTNTQGSIVNTKVKYLRRRVRHRMGSILTPHRDVRVLDTTGSSKINQRPRTNSNFLRHFNARKKVKEDHHSNFYRQSYSA